jgi:predicted metal-binding membrane protein
VLFVDGGFLAAWSPGLPGIVAPMESGLGRVLQRQRLILVCLLAILTGLSWVSMARMAAEAPGGGRLPPCCETFALTFWMWVVMMAGMMIPSATPMVLTHAALVRRRVGCGGQYVSSALFLSGYLAAWTGFSFVAALAEWALQRSSLLDPGTLRVRPVAAALVLLSAGVFQLSPVKNVCLSQCRAPLGYFLTEWREGRFGAFVMGLRHGWSCIGCCWLLMAILFAAGVMSLWWGAALTAFVIAEKLLPWPRLAVWSGAILCFVGGAVVLAGAVN